MWSRCRSHFELFFFKFFIIQPEFEHYDFLPFIFRSTCYIKAAALELRLRTHGGDSGASWSEFSKMDGFLSFFFKYIYFQVWESRVRAANRRTLKREVKVSPVVRQLRWLTNHFVPILHKKPIKEAAGLSVRCAYATTANGESECGSAAPKTLVCN